MKRLCQILLPIFIATPQELLHAQTQPTKKLQESRYSQLCFVENVGQIRDQHGRKRDDILFKLQGNGINIFVGKTGLHYQFFKEPKNDRSKRVNDLFSTVPETRTKKTETYRIDIELLGVNKNPVITKESEGDFYENYYLPGVNGLVAHSYQKITYKDIYPDIDWVLYIKDNKLQSDFIVHPGGDAKKIRMQYNGYGKFVATPTSIVALTPLGNVSDQGLFVYNQNSYRQIAASFKVKKNVVGFDIAEHDGTIVIDPSIVWATYFGGSGTEQEFSAVSDVNANIFICGLTGSTSNLATSGSYEYTPPDAFNGYIAKFDSSGHIIWATFYGGDRQDFVSDVACDDAGDVYATGITESDTGLATAGSFQTSKGTGPINAFLVKFNSSGSRLWGTYYGGDSETDGLSVVCDHSGNVYMTGLTYSDSLATAGAYQDSLAGLCDAFLVKFNNSGLRQWATYFGGPLYDNALAIDVDSFENIYIGGETGSNINIATPGAYRTTPLAPLSGFLAKFNYSGGVQWATYYGGDSNTTIRHIATDYASNIYIRGFTPSRVGISTPSAYKTSLNGVGSGSFLAKFNTNGAMQWSTYYGDTSQGYAVRCDGTGCVYISGETWASAGIATAGAYRGSLTGIMPDEYIAKFSPWGQRMWGSYYGCAAGNPIWLNTDGIACDPANNIYFTSGTYCNSDIATAGAYQTYLAGSNDAFLVKVGTDTSVIPSQFFNDTLICKGGTFSLPYLVNHPFRPGNVFTAQLSDVFGGFSTPTNIGFVTSTTSGNITCTIPSTIAAGSTYRIRVVASAPVFISPNNGFDLTIASSIPHTISISSNSPVCPGDSLKLSAAAPRGSFYRWIGPAAFTSILQSSYISPFNTANAGTYFVFATAPGCDTIGDSTVVSVHPIVTPKVNIVYTPIHYSLPGDSITFYASITNCGTSASYKWYKNNLLIPGASSWYFGTKALTTGDVISVSVHCNWACSDPDSAVGSIALLRLDNFATNKILTIYPNPNEGNFILSGTIQSKYNYANMEVLNILGQTVYKAPVAIINGVISQKIEVKLPSGFYILKLSTESAVTAVSFSVN